MVNIFNTNVDEENISVILMEKLLEQFPESRINFDLEDCDKIL